MTRLPYLTRRQFLQGLAAATAAAVPSIIPATARGADGHVAPSNRIVIGCIGMGGMGRGNLASFLGKPEVQVVGVCDVDTQRLADAKATVDKAYGNQDCATYVRFEELLARGDLDALSLATPDHWHAIPAIAAARAGLDIYGEKPITQNIREGRAVCEAVRRYGRVWQTGSWQRSRKDFHHAAQLVLNGRIGKVTHVHVGLPSGHGINGDPREIGRLCDAPAELDYDRWIGPAPWRPYCIGRTHWNWRWQMDLGGGQLTDWVGHHVDIAHWGLGLENTGPVRVEGRGDFPRSGIFDTATRYRIDCTYANGITITVAGGHPDIRMGTKWFGTDGWIWVDRSGIDAHPKSLLKELVGPNEKLLTKSLDHHQNFLDCIRTRRQAIAPAEAAHRAASVGHLGNIAMLTGRPIHWDPEREEIIGDPGAAAMLGRPCRPPWHL